VTALCQARRGCVADRPRPHAEAVRAPAVRCSTRARSSVGQSSRLIIGWSLVRVQAGPLQPRVHAERLETTGQVCRRGQKRACGVSPVPPARCNPTPLAYRNPRAGVLKTLPLGPAFGNVTRAASPSNDPAKDRPSPPRSLLLALVGVQASAIDMHAMPTSPGRSTQRPRARGWRGACGKSRPGGRRSRQPPRRRRNFGARRFPSVGRGVAPTRLVSLSHTE
jgi:hypothetical protein